MGQEQQTKTTTDRRTAKRISILQAAIKAFETEGYEGASMDRIAELAPASKRTVYNYFPSKEDLLMAVIKDLAQDQAPLTHIQFDPSQSLEAQLERFMDAQLYVVTDSTRLALARVLTSIFVRHPDLAEKACQGFEPPHHRFTLWLKAAHEHGALDVPDPKTAATLFYGLAEGLFNYPALFKPLQSKSELSPLIKEAITLFLSRYRP